MRAIASVILICGSVANAQSVMDPSSALLLNPSPRATGRSSEKADTSARYSVRSRSSVERAEKSERSEKPAASKRSTEPAVQAALVPVIIAPTAEGTVVILREVPAGKKAGEESVATEKTPENKPENKPEKTPETKLETADSHILEIAIATAYLYENSDSGYSYRQSTMGGPAYGAQARSWLASEFGVGGHYYSTLGGQINERGSALAASRTDLGYGIFLKKNFAASNLVLGVEWVDSDFKVASESVSKLKTKSSGVRVAIEGEFRTSDMASWTLGFSAMPKLQHTETAAATDVRSGTSVNAYAVGASLMRRWSLDRSSSVFVRVEHKVERDLFSGTATGADPVGGATPTGVSATVGTTLIQFGYGWAD